MNVSTDKVEIADEPTDQELYAAKFTAQTGQKPAGEVKVAVRMMSRARFFAGLEAQVKFKGIDGEDFLKTVFTPIREYRRDNNKYVPHHNQRTRPDGPQSTPLLSQAAGEHAPDGGEPEIRRGDLPHPDGDSE